MRTGRSWWARWWHGARDVESTLADARVMFGTSEQEQAAQTQRAAETRRDDLRRRLLKIEAEMAKTDGHHR